MNFSVLQRFGYDDVLGEVRMCTSELCIAIDSDGTNALWCNSSSARHCLAMPLIDQFSL